MFSSGSNPFPEFPSSPNIFFPPNFHFNHEKDCACFNYHLNNSDPLISGDCFHDTNNSLAPPSPPIHNITTIKQDFGRQKQLSSEEQVFQTCEDHDDLQSVISSCKKKTVASKDGHSKIYTARGPRDRRVRLSIDISRKFFCLQDLLGFDKASKTLDWLFSKCKIAIKELVEETNFYSSSTSTASYQSKTSFLEAMMGVRDGGKLKKKSELKYVKGKAKKITQKSKGGFQDNLERGHSRAMARARARERVRDKKRIRKLDELTTIMVHDDFDYQDFKSSAGDNHMVISAHPAVW
ncbi:unnamed protein product [Lactuca virosa]|uniref:Cycloidea-like protein n=1 Tax=Lactuca virosa TaxID=75947 RepID=A0AAU9M2R0_9ASTR|nr:unnamed protein product [Lactuca virosa]